MEYNAVIRWLGCGIMAVSLLVCPLFLVREGDRKSRNNRKGLPPQRNCCANLGTHTFAEDIPVCLSGCYTDEDCKLQGLLHESERDEKPPFGRVWKSAHIHLHTATSWQPYDDDRHSGYCSSCQSTVYEYHWEYWDETTIPHCTRCGYVA